MWRKKKKRYVDMLLMMPDETMKDSGSTKTEEMKRKKKGVLTYRCRERKSSSFQTSSEHSPSRSDRYSTGIGAFSMTDMIVTARPCLTFAPWMLHDLLDPDALVDVSVQHQPDEIDTVLAHDEGYPKILVHNLVNRIEWVFLVDDGVQQNAQCPDVLLLAAIGLAG